ncbi:MAG TPA: DUF5320 domain-containing protein [Methanomassiliicoccales archaeon]|nr:DUF5320 domain-containing protein [Methanomassiliicoccales archaeon]HNX47150.1 DUF5320 domain-containing protein [Methanomassiliicoccales archaeon]HPR98803.1 DUF5320 domain-containing protein [Methanomassiliicoccales archaeon]HSA35305.1 DUF5320 domain-containing protein [Methanomassiliicoccales archaeon]
MPYRDGAGPQGTGPNGRGMGPCRSGGRVAFGMGRDRRMGHGRGFRFMSECSEADLNTNLEAKVEALEARLKYLKAQLAGEGKGSP